MIIISVCFILYTNSFQVSSIGGHSSLHAVSITDVDGNGTDAHGILLQLFTKAQLIICKFLLVAYTGLCAIISVYPTIITCLMYSVLFFHAAALQKGFLSIALQLSPLFWLAFIIRIKCLTSFFQGQLCKRIFPCQEAVDDDDGYYEDNDDDDDDDDEHRHTLYTKCKRIVSFIRTSSPKCLQCQ